MKHQSIVERVQDKQKDFHHFMESSRMLVEDNKPIPTEQHEKEPVPSPFQQFSKISVGKAGPSQ